MNEEDEKGLWDARRGLRTSLGLGFEVGANTLLDIFSFIPPAQVAGGTFINYLAQKIRGGEISKGELTAAGLTSLIPGGTQARALTRGGRFYRSVAKGGLAGGITTTSMSLIDEGELPSFGEFAGGVGLGGAFGGAFDLAPAAVTGRLGKEVSEIADDTLNFTSALRNKIRTGTREATKGLDVFREGGVMDIGAGGLGKSESFSRGMSSEYENLVTGGMKAMGMENNVFDINLYNKNSPILAEMIDTLSGRLLKDGTRQTKRLGKRSWMEYFLSPESLKGNFEALRKAGKTAADETWESFLKKRNLTTADIQLHHINPLYDSMHLFDGVQWGSDEYWDIISILMRGGARPGVVDTKEMTNLIKTLGNLRTDTPHGIAHAFYRDIMPTFFSTTELTSMRVIPGYRLQKARDWAKIVNKSEEIVTEAHKAWTTLNPNIRMSFEELIETMSKYDNTGFLTDINQKYQVKEIRDMVLNINIAEQVEPLPNIAFPNLSEMKQRMLLYAAQPGVTRTMIKRKFPGFDFEQLELDLNE